MKGSIETKRLVFKMSKKIAAKYKPKKIILFGSYVYGTPDEDSDIDMFIIKETKERPIDRWMSVCKIVSDKKRRAPFEAIVLTPQELNERIRIGDQFIEEILTKGEVLYASDSLQSAKRLIDKILRLTSGGIDDQKCDI